MPSASASEASITHQRVASMDLFCQIYRNRRNNVELLTMTAITTFDTTTPRCSANTFFREERGVFVPECKRIKIAASVSSELDQRMKAVRTKKQRRITTHSQVNHDRVRCSRTL